MDQKHPKIFSDFLDIAYRTRLRSKFLCNLNPPEGMTSKDIRHMSEGDLLDMDYFLYEDDLDDDFGEEGFYLF